MAQPSPASLMRELNGAQNGMRKARQALVAVRQGAMDPEVGLKAGWEALQSATRVLAAVPLASADDDVMGRQIAVQRYATALLVRLRRLKRKGVAGLGDDDGDLGDDEA
jgi:hypothetical protein